MLSHFLAAFEEIRSPRIAYVTRAETSLRNLVMTPEKQELKKLEDLFKLVGRMVQRITSLMTRPSQNSWTRLSVSGFMMRERMQKAGCRNGEAGICRNERLLRPRYISLQMCHCSQNESYPFEFPVLPG